MTSKLNPPMTTHQPGVPAVSASRKKPGGSPKPSSSSPASLVQCHLNNGPVPKVGGIVWLEMWPRWKAWHVLEWRSHDRRGAQWVLLDLETGVEIEQFTDKLFMPK